MRRVIVTYHGGPGLPEHGLNPQIPRLGQLLKGKPRHANLLEESILQARRLPGTDVEIVKPEPEPEPEPEPKPEPKKQSKTKTKTTTKAKAENEKASRRNN